MQHLRPAFTLIAVFTLLTGLAFPFAFTGFATGLVPGLAGGSLITQGGHVIGSSLIGQAFTKPGYFHGRPSATTPAYNASASSGSNLGPTSKALVARVKADVAAMGATPVPADAVTTSASGLDPDISPANAERQVARVAAARHLPEDQVRALVASHVQGRFLGIFGEPHVNVLALNLALDKIGPQ